MKLTVVIPCLNEADFITSLLEDLNHQTFRDFCVVVVDSQSEDDTVKVVKSFKPNYPLEVISSPRGVANARNAGASKAKSEWIYFLDADAGLPPEFLACSIEEAERRKIDIATPVFRPKTNRLSDRIGGLIVLMYCRSVTAIASPIAGGFAILARRSVHEQVGGFKPDLRMGEDHYYAIEAKRAGRRFAYLTSTYVWFSMRRFEQIGRMRLLLINVASEAYRFTHNYRIQTDAFKYEFGKFKRHH